MHLIIRPSGRLQMQRFSAGESTAQATPDERIEQAFALSTPAGLIALAGDKVASDWPLSWRYWRDFTARYLVLLCQMQTASEQTESLPPPDEATIRTLHHNIPPMPGAEYVSPDLLIKIWQQLDAWVMTAIAAEAQGCSGFLQRYAPSWHQVGRVCFHLAENKNDPDYPFAFMATYIPKLGKNARAQHLPLRQALVEYAGAKNNKALVRLLEPVYAAAKGSGWVEELVASGDIYHPLAWTPAEAYLLLKDLPVLEASGLVVRLPNWWKKRPRPKVQVQIGAKIPSQFSARALLDFQVHVSLEGEPLQPDEIRQLLATTEGFVFLRGQWVEVSGEQLRHALDHWQKIQARAGEGGLSFIEGMRLLAGVDRGLAGNEPTLAESGWAFVEAGDSLKNILHGLRQPEHLEGLQSLAGLQAQLRPYQQVGLNWLWFLTELGLGACLADDMGLGKTIQVIALLVAQKECAGRSSPSLLVAPASLLANWESECSLFAPELQVVLVHPAAITKAALKEIGDDPQTALAGVDVVVTTYSMVQRQEWLQKLDWNLIVLDEAQAIKNPGARQARSVKNLSGRARLALTGTPVENRLSDLWSLFDFIAPGLLGSAQAFKRFSTALTKQQPPSFGALRSLVGPYILRRLKTDRSVIADLPDKIIIAAWCGLSKSQAVLYQQAVVNLADAMQAQVEGMQRRGLILAALLRFKQICNHSDQAMGNGDYAEGRSGKFARLREICEEIASRQEKVLVFTQFREMTQPLADFLLGIFQQPGLVLHGGTPVATRKKLVEQFQNESGPPFFVLSLKAGGTGLNLTAANHVIHFDRWWNPAVENQATDRAFRIGQKKNVVVHTFICKGTIEEKIDVLIREKTKLATEILHSGETLLTEMNDKELLDLVKLDISQAML